MPKSLSRYEAEGLMGSDGHVYERGSLADRVHTALVEGGTVEATRIRVVCGLGDEEGEIVLIGPVTCAEERALAQEIALAVRGVHTVDNRLVVC